MTEVEQLRAELEQAQSQLRLLRSVFDHAPAFIAHITPDGKFLFLNRMDADHTKAVEGTSIYDWTPPESHATMRQVIAHVVATGEHGEYESAAGPPGAQLPYYTRVAPLANADGVVDSVVLIATDTRLLKQTESALMESQAYLQHVLDATGTGTWWWDIDRNVGARDERTAKLFGVDVKDAGMDTLESFVHPDDRERVRKEFAAGVSEHGQATFEHRFIRSDGAIRWISASARRIDGPSGRRMIGGVRDITERKLLEDRLAKAHKLESIGRLAGGIAHDFNNMLTVITSNTDLALRKLPESSPLHRDLAAVRTAAERCTALTYQMLALARRQLARPDLVHIDELIARTDASLRRSLGRNIELVMKLGAGHRVRIDAGQFEQVLTQLASNARDAMPDGGRVTVSTTDVVLTAAEAAAHPGAQPVDYVKITVVDTGFGISAQDLEHIFEPFFTTKQEGKGTGLGLATSYGLIAQNGGFMTVASTPGAGATFEVFLPAAS